MIRVQVGNHSAKEFQKEDIEKIKSEIDVQVLGNNIFSVIANHKSHEISISSVDKESKTITLSINGTQTTVKWAQKLDILLEKMGIDTTASNKLTVLKSPMPGLVVEWFVNEGDTVLAGDKLLILEAMKMENVIKSSGDGVIQKINVEKGMAVEKNQVLINFG